ncbi:MAG: dihydropteroate synthase [Synergistaceae bacterium]|jgi:dihydropteroate synthase|nr:dihydropteroate synthase [Synergistaceae bacterium]
MFANEITQKIDVPAVIYPLNIHSSEELGAMIRRIGADPRSNAYFQPKRRRRHLFVESADFRAAAYVKQELLARGGDAVVAKHVIDGKADRSDVLLIGTDGQLNALSQKMEAMNCWGLKELRNGLLSVLRNTAVSSWTLPLPSGRELRLDARTKIMGILNLTEDSFHAGSRVKNIDDLLERASAMLRDGADVLDVGAESTRPGSTPLPEEEELARLIPGVKALREALPHAVLSVDTYKGKVAAAAAAAGADIVNDVGGFELDPDMLTCAARSGLPYVLSHIKGTPSDMQNAPSYDDLLSELNVYFQKKIERAERAGLRRERLILDPGLGFGKRAKDNLLILKEVESLSVFGRPILLGYSRKKFTGTITDAEKTDDRLLGTAAISALVEGRVQMTRVHDVRENGRALLMARAIRETL